MQNQRQQIKTTRRESRDRGGERVGERGQADTKKHEQTTSRCHDRSRDKNTHVHIGWCTQTPKTFKQGAVTENKKERQTQRYRDKDRGSVNAHCTPLFQRLEHINNLRLLSVFLWQDLRPLPAGDGRAREGMRERSTATQNVAPEAAKILSQRFPRNSS